VKAAVVDVVVVVVCKPISPPPPSVQTALDNLGLQDTIEKQFQHLWPLAFLQVLPGGLLPILSSFKRLRNGGARTTFSIFPRDEIFIDPLTELQVPLYLRFMIDFPASFHFASTKKLKDDRPHLQISPNVAGTDIRYISNLGVTISNSAEYTERISPHYPLLEIVTYTRKFETPLRPAKHISCRWRSNILGHTYPIYSVDDPITLPFF
jgi:hypothetical protein